MLTERLPYRYNLGCLLWSSVSEPIITAYTSARAVIYATPQCMLARYSFQRLGDIFCKGQNVYQQNMFGSLSGFDRSFLQLWSKTCTYPQTGPTTTRSSNFKTVRISSISKSEKMRRYKCLKIIMHHYRSHSGRPKRKKIHRLIRGCSVISSLPGFLGFRAFFPIGFFGNSTELSRAENSSFLTFVFSVVFLVVLGRTKLLVPILIINHCYQPAETKKKWSDRYLVVSTSFDRKCVDNGRQKKKEKKKS